MLPTSHLSPTNVLPVPPFEQHTGEALLLADAFSEFIRAAGTLESSYRDLQVEVGQLGMELAERNRELEESLRENEQMRLTLVELVDSLPCGVLVLGAEGQLLRMNPEAKRLLSPDAMEPAPVDLGEVWARTGIDLGAFCAIEGESEVSFFLRDGGERWVELRTRRLQAQTILILADISTHKQAERDREAGRKALALAEVAAMLAHEVRNPLASLELFVELLENEPKRAAEWLKHMRAGLRSLGNTVGNVLSFHGKGALPLAPAVVADVVRTAAEFVRPVAMQAGVELRVAMCGGRHMAAASEGAVQQLLLNLVMNAVRHTPPGGEIVIGLKEASAGYVRLSVTDTGCGMTAAEVEKVFVAGWSGSGVGSGLGLAVCQRIAAQHGTVLRVASEPERGACFFMDLQIVPVRLAEAELVEVAAV